MTTAYEEYIMLLPELDVIYPNLTGDWERDKKLFTKIWEENQKIIKG